MKRICILCLLAALLLGACGLADAPYMEPVRTYCAALQDDDFTRLQEAIPPAVLNADGFDAGELANVRDSFAKGSSNDYDITPKELDSRRIPESVRKREAKLFFSVPSRARGLFPPAVRLDYDRRRGTARQIPRFVHGRAGWPAQCPRRVLPNRRALVP